MRVFALLWLLLFTSLQGPSASSQDATSLTPRPNLWELKRQGETTYLLGTIHLGVTASQHLPPAVWTLIDGAKQVIIEADVESVNVAQLGLGDGKNLRSVLSAPAWEKLCTELRDIATPSEIDELSPTLAIGLLTQARLARIQSNEILELSAQIPVAEISMDMEIFRRAKANSIPTAFLETRDAQMRAILAKPEALEASIAQTDSEVESTILRTLHGLKSVIENYSSGKTFSLSHDVEAINSADTNLLKQRNQNWIAGIESAHKEGGAFIAVGGAHLLGQDGLLRILRERGFTVKKVFAVDSCEGALTGRRTY